jgi:hypothetical protein
MSSSFNSFTRALSPSIDALTQAVISASVSGKQGDVDEGLERLSNEMLYSLHAKISESRSVDDVVNVVYSDYRLRYREHLLLFASWADKLETVQSSLARLESTVTAGNVPQRLKVKAPEFQLTKDFGDSGSDEARTVKESFKTATDVFQTSITAAAVAAKKAELKFWRDKCDSDKCAEKLADIASVIWNDRRKSFLIPSITYDEEGKCELGEWKVSPQKRAERDVLCRTGHLLAIQILSIVNIRHRALDKKIEKKRTVAETADVEMADATKPGPSIQSLIDKGLNARLKKLNLVPGGKKVRSYPSPPTCANDYSTYTEFVWPEYRQESYPSLYQEKQVRKAQIHANQGEQQAEGQEKGKRESFNSGPRSKGQRETTTKKEVTSSFVSPFIPSTLPDKILTMTWDSAVSFVHLHTPLSLIEAGRYRSHVHASNDIVIPPEIANDLSLGLKYMCFSPPSKSLIKEAWSEFQTKLRWRIFFLFKEGMNTVYDPDYRVIRASKKAPPKLPQWMELGLVMGRRVVNKTLTNIPDETIMEMRKQPFSPKFDRIRRFLLDNNYVITMTDKNLGLAVSERDWLINNELKLLHDERNYKELSKVRADAIMNKKCKQMQKLADMTIDHLVYSELKLYDFFESKITEPGSEHIYPVFHGLPKIHKTPTGFRPIIPCHSVVFNPAAKFISKELKPIVKAAPSVIHGTKDLFNRLSQLCIDNQKQWFFVTGDVVAFYPNIPLRSCMDAVCGMYEEWLLNNAKEDPTSTTDSAWMEAVETRRKIFESAIEIGNTQLITQHGDKYYEQLNGLAMGVADSPDLANLWGVHFEKRSNILTDQKVPYYGRYIDDILSLVYAKSAEEALEYIKNKISFDGCVIEWAVSEFKCQFLDAELYKQDGKLEWRPFVKLGNNRERIPWVSHHPLDVKRGVYIGECSRLAVLCSTKGNYIGAIKDLNALYLIRGYPEQLVASWCRNNIQERWEKRFAIRSQPEHDEGVLVLKTRFDDVWNWFSAAELGKAVTEYWSEWYTRAEAGSFIGDATRPFLPDDPEDNHDITDVRPDLFAEVQVRGGDTVSVPDLRKIGLLGRRWIVSRKRNTNLFDLTNNWKKTVFRKMDEAISEEGGVVPQISSNVDTDLLEAHRSMAQTVSIEEDEVINIHRRDRSEDREHPEFGRISKTHNR